jgi:hypothetical protein
VPEIAGGLRLLGRERPTSKSAVYLAVLHGKRYPSRRLLKCRPSAAAPRQGIDPRWGGGRIFRNYSERHNANACLAPSAQPLCTQCHAPGGRLEGFFSSTETSNVRVCAKLDSTAGPVGQPLHPFHRRDALPRGTFNDGADGGDNAEEKEEHCGCNRR